MKTPLILISGLLSDQSLWLHQLEHLSSDAQIQVYSPSEDSPNKMLQAILEKAPNRFALAGHSMGGWLCLEIMRIAPARVAKLCLLNTTAKLDSEEKKSKRLEMIHKAETGNFKEIVDEMAKLFVFHSQVIEDVKKMFLTVGKKTFIRQERSMLARQECQSILPSIPCPTLVIHSTQDKVFKLEDHKELVENIPLAKSAIIEDCGHMSPFEMPQAVTTLLKYWLTYF